MGKAMRRHVLVWLGGFLVAGLATSSVAQETSIRARGRRLAVAPTADPSGGCAFPFIVDATNVNIAYPDPNATYWAMPFRLGAGESLVLKGNYPSARFMAVTLYDDVGDTIEQLSDFEIAPDPGSANPFAVADPPSGSGRQWSIHVVRSGATSQAANVIELDPEQRSGWLLYRVYLGNPAGDLQGGEPLPAIVRKRGPRVTRTLAPCTAFLPGTVIAGLLNAALPEPLDVTESPQFVQLANDAGLFANEANAYLSAFADAAPGVILVVRGLLPTTPDTSAGQSVVGDFDMRYFSITSNLNQKPYPTVAGDYDAELPLDEDGSYTVVIAQQGDVPSNATAANGVAVLAWGDGDSQAVIIRNMLPSSDFGMAVQDVTPSAYGEPSDAASVMSEFYPQIVSCTTVTFEAEGADGCFADSP